MGVFLGFCAFLPNPVPAAAGDEALVVPFRRNVAPALNVLSVVLEEGGLRTGRTQEIVLPVLLRLAPDQQDLPGFPYLRRVCDGYAVAYLGLAELRQLEDCRAVRYASLAGSPRLRGSDLRDQLWPAPSVPSAMGADCSVLVGVIDQQTELALTADPGLAEHLVASWNQRVQDRTPQDLPAGARDPTPPVPSVHGSVVLSLIRRLCPQGAGYVVVESTWEEADTLLAVLFIKDIARRLNRPAIVNISAAGSAGPHDGSTLFEEIVSASLDAGFMVVTAAGNDGSKAQHAEFRARDIVQKTVELGFLVPAGKTATPYEISLDVWFDRKVDCRVAVKTPSSSLYGPVPSGQGCVYQQDNAWVCICNDVSEPANGHTNLLVILKNHGARENWTGEWQIILQFATPSAFVADVWLAPAPGSTGHFTRYVSQTKTISPLATARGVIAVGARSAEAGGFAVLSAGPTRDGRPKPDVFVTTRHSTSYAAACVTGLLAQVQCEAPFRPLPPAQLLRQIARQRDDVALSTAAPAGEE